MSEPKQDIATRTVAVTYSRNQRTGQIEYHLGIRGGNMKPGGYYRPIRMRQITEAQANDILEAIEAQIRTLVDGHADPGDRIDKEVWLDLAEAGYSVTDRSTERRKAIGAVIKQGAQPRHVESALVRRREGTDSEVQKAVLQNDIWFIRTEVRA